MREPTTSPAGAQNLGIDRRRLAWLLVLLPVLLLGGAWLGSQFAAPASRLHPTVSLADQLARAQGTAPKFGALSPDDLALERARQEPKEILTQAAAIRRKFATGGWIFGAWVGLVIGVKLVSLSVRRQRTDYEPDRGDCFACARCFEYCPNELVRRGLMPAAAPAAGGMPGASHVQPLWRARQYERVDTEYAMLRIARAASCFPVTPTASFIPAQGNALGSWPVVQMQANGLAHSVGSGWSSRCNANRSRYVSQSQSRVNRAFSAPNYIGGPEPRALPWAGMNQAFGLKANITASQRAHVGAEEMWVLTRTKAPRLPSIHRRATKTTVSRSTEGALPC